MTKKDKILLTTLREYLNGHIGEALIAFRYVKYMKKTQNQWIKNYFNEKKKSKNN